MSAAGWDCKTGEYTEGKHRVRKSLLPQSARVSAAQSRP